MQSSASPDDRRLARLGYDQSFYREFNQYSTLSFAISVLGVLGSVPATYGVPLLLGGPATTVWAWLLGSCMSMSIAASVAELVSAYPSAGGMYLVTQKVVPKDKAPLYSWMVGWANFLGQTAGVSSLGYSVSQQILAVITLNTESRFAPKPWQTVLLSILILSVVGAICILPTQALHRIIYLFAPIQIAAALAISLALLLTAPGLQSPSWVFGNFTSGSGWNNKGFSFLLGFSSVAWVMTDYDGTSHLAEETRNPSKRGPVAIVSAVAIAGLVGFLLNITLSFCIRDVDRTLQSTTGLAAAQIIFDVSGFKYGSIIWFFVVLTQFFTCCAAMLGDTRMAFAFARDRAFPFSNFFARVNPHTTTPVNAVWLVVACSIGLNLIAVGSVETSTAIFNVTAPALDLSYVAVIVLRRFYGKQIQFQPGSFTLGKWSLPLNICAVLWVVFISAVLFFPAIRPITAANMNYAVCVAMAIASFAVLWWYAGARRFYKGPPDDQYVPHLASKTFGSEEEKGIL